MYQAAKITIFYNISITFDIIIFTCSYKNNTERSFVHFILFSPMGTFCKVIVYYLNQNIDIYQSTNLIYIALVSLALIYLFVCVLSSIQFYHLYSFIYTTVVKILHNAITTNTIMFLIYNNTHFLSVSPLTPILNSRQPLNLSSFRKMLLYQK